MPTRDTGDQQRKSRDTSADQAEDTAAPESDLAARKEALDADIDAILDDALETNAEEFVRGFVQKGGQ
jgi:ubiquitin-like protein Pup